MRFTEGSYAYRRNESIAPRGKVAFGLLSHFILEKRESQFIADIISFYRRIGLPTSLKELGLEHLDMRKIEKAVEMVLVEGSFIYNMPFPIVKKMVIDAILQADSLGRLSL